MFYLIYFVWLFNKTKVPFMGTRKKISDLILKNTDLKNKKIVDLGSGIGDFLFSAEKQNPKRLVGVELSYLFYFFSKFRCYFKKSKVVFLKKNFFEFDIGDFDVVYFFLTNRVISKVQEKILKEAKKGALIISLDCELTDIKACKVLKTDIGSRIYFYLII